ncbi:MULTISPECIES: DUF4250 domain-containing protein [Anaerofustis]|uniref:DUF4250 domain-containing protein n=1 Tax=Anaerofustis TaxID=264995 RepID=UPI001105EC31|nr:MULTISPECIES: DUF4250 domain-containing protein [Anaerofustis]MCO8193788.1 DUF4250 domain-containing protein [Anaerofustis sp. NSJ-163]
MDLPKDPIILLSFINTKLRDFYPNLHELCMDLSVDEEEIINKLSSVGYEYNKERNCFE